ncbi:alpha/beta hydrolase [Flavivirga sp. 57AJ16]|uniref:alpha/beta hydrolase n=1 Tax=Flavivirga sp. 57AJ16 TaxID=3025307 RepID=UPI0023673D6D|nr:dienelactone hydrolase family protein [Flavivirga sp. 57AJ16]MDD7886174.1 dienelactone hydrolase family protein [Flavivirga sp. 57AJ16]
MNSSEKEISYQTTNTYSTLNILTDETEHVWLVCHGMGYLSRYFLKYFKELNAKENYIIAPQASSKYYLHPQFKHVGASWLTKENTLAETENVLRYLDAVLKAENIPKDKKLIVLGYSQGVSIATRYIAKRKLQCSQLVLHSGGIPKELVADDLKFLKAKVSLVYGTNDAYLNKERIEVETERAIELFGNDINIIPFDGIHEVNVKLINGFV